MYRIFIWEKYVSLHLICLYALLLFITHFLLSIITRIFFVSTLACVVLLFSGNINAQAVEQGNILIDATWGPDLIPSFYKTLFESQMGQAGTSVTFSLKVDIGVHG